MLLLLLACASYELANDAAYSTSLDCGYVVSDVAWDDASVLGVAPAALLAPHLGTFSADGLWADGTAVQVKATIAPSGALPSFAAAEGGDGGTCGNQLLVPIVATLTTDDGAFDERFEVDWVVLPDDAQGPTTLPFGGQREDESLDGSFREDDVAVSGDEEVQWLTVAASHGPGGLHGRVGATVWSDGEDAGEGPILTW